MIVCEMANDLHTPVSRIVIPVVGGLDLIRHPRQADPARHSISTLLFQPAPASAPFLGVTFPSCHSWPVQSPDGRRSTTVTALSSLQAASWLFLARQSEDAQAA